VTIDTHAVAAQQMRPHGGSALEVSHNFQNSIKPEETAAGELPAKGSDVTGIQGTYPFNADAYREAAAARRVLPRQMQSVTWEGGRGLFSPEFKRNKAKVAQVNDVWHNYDAGHLSLDQAHRQIIDLAGGIDVPSWAGRRGAAAEETWPSSYKRELPAYGAYGAGAEGQLGAGEQPAGASAGLDEAQVAKYARARGLGRAVRNARAATGLQAGLPGTYRGVVGRAALRELAPDLPVIRAFEPHPAAAAHLSAAGMSAPHIVELSHNAQGAGAFHQALADAQASNQHGAAVTLKDSADYRKMRLFMTPDSAAGFALDGDDIVSVFSNSAKKIPHAANAMMDLAVQQGGRRLDAYDTMLPHIYGRNGFEAVSRLPWDDEHKPAGWNPALMRDFNGGKPDVVHMVWNPNRANFYNSSEGVRLTDYNQALKIQAQAVKKMNNRIAALTKEKKANGGAVDPDQPQEFNPSRIFQFADGGLVDRALQIVRANAPALSKLARNPASVLTPP